VVGFLEVIRNNKKAWKNRDRDKEKGLENYQLKTIV